MIKGYWIWLAAVGALLIPGHGLRAADPVGDLLEKHQYVMSANASLFADEAVLIEFAEGNPADGKRINFHWQMGNFRQEYVWLGFTEIFCYNGDEHWYGSDLSLPYNLGSDSSPDVTSELIKNFAYLQPQYVDNFSAAKEVPLGLDERFIVLRYKPEGMSEALLLLDPFDYRLSGYLYGTSRLISQSPLYKLTLLEDWTDYGTCWYPTVMRHETLSPEGELLKEKRSTTLSVDLADRLPEHMFETSSSPDVPQPGLPTVPYVVPFSFLNDTVLISCKGPKGRLRKLELDTGAAVGVLRRDVAAEIGMSLHGNEMVTGHGGSAPVMYGRAEGFVLKGRGQEYTVELPPWPAAVLMGNSALDDSLKAKGADGLLGNFLLSNFVVTLDYRRKLVLLYPPDQFDPLLHLSEGYNAIPVTRDSMPYVQVMVDDKISGGAFFNTGAQQYFTLSAWACDAAGVTYEIEDFAEAVTVRGYTAFGIIRPEKVQLGGLEIIRPRTHIEILAPGEAPNPNRIASFGNEFFNRNRVTFDLFNNMYYIEGV